MSRVRAAEAGQETSWMAGSMVALPGGPPAAAENLEGSLCQAGMEIRETRGDCTASVLSAPPNDRLFARVGQEGDGERFQERFG